MDRLSRLKKKLDKVHIRENFGRYNHPPTLPLLKWNWRIVIVTQLSRKLDFFLLFKKQREREREINQQNATSEDQVFKSINCQIRGGWKRPSSLAVRESTRRQVWLCFMERRAVLLTLVGKSHCLVLLQVYKAFRQEDPTKQESFHGLVVGFVSGKGAVFIRHL